MKDAGNKRKPPECPECGKSAQAIKEVLDSGGMKPKSHEERLRRLREAGLPVRIVRESTG